MTAPPPTDGGAASPTSVPPSPQPVPPTPTPGQENVAPVLSGLAEQMVYVGKPFPPLFLDDYAQDEDDGPDALVWSASGQVDLEVTIADRVATVTSPDPLWVGSETVRLEACDPAGSCAAADVAFTVLEEAEVEITYICNAGFLISSKGKKILVDALFQGTNYGCPFAPYMTAIKLAEPPFDGVDLVLVTHDHDDHFDAEITGTHLANNPKAVLVSTEQVIDSLREGFPGFEEFEDRTIALRLVKGESTRIALTGIGLEVINIPHVNMPGGGVLNLGFLIDVGGVRLFHPGDAEPEEWSKPYFQGYRLSERGIDVAFVPRGFLANEEYHGVVREGIRASDVIAMHFLAGAAGAPGAIERVFPEAIVLEESMDRWVGRYPSTASSKPPTEPRPDLGQTWVRPADGMVAVYVPGGSFPMGSSGDQVSVALSLCAQFPDDYGKCAQETFEGEVPQHVVTLDSYWIDRTEVSNAQYQRCVDAGLCNASRLATDPSFNQADFPVAGVPWQDAAAYCAWAGARLPTEAEWEYAARGPDGSSFPWGGDFDCSGGNFWDRDTACDDGFPSGPAPVGSFPDGASWCGALDMAGNAWEWVADRFAQYPNEEQVNPTGPAAGDQHILRGGSWGYGPAFVRSAYRYPVPGSADYQGVGFRCVVEASPVPMGTGTATDLEANVYRADWPRPFGSLGGIDAAGGERKVPGTHPLASAEHRGDR